MVIREAFSGRLEPSKPGMVVTGRWAGSHRSGRLWDVAGFYSKSRVGKL